MYQSVITCKHNWYSGSSNSIMSDSELELEFNKALEQFEGESMPKISDVQPDSIKIDKSGPKLSKIYMAIDNHFNESDRSIKHQLLDSVRNTDNMKVYNQQTQPGKQSGMNSVQLKCVTIIFIKSQRVLPSAGSILMLLDNIDNFTTINLIELRCLLELSNGCDYHTYRLWN